MAGRGANKILMKEAKLWSIGGKYEDMEECSMEIESVFKWSLTLEGPKGTPYEDGVFYINLKFSNRYPTVPPEVTFVSKIYHPSVKLSGSDCGKLCKDIIGEPWATMTKPGQRSVMAVVEILLNIMKNPPTDSPVEADIAKQLRDNKALFEKTAKEYTEKYCT